MFILKENFIMDYSLFSKLSERNFVQIFKDFNVNYVFLDPGFINYIFKKRISVCFVDEKVNDSYVCLDKIKSSMGYKNLIEMANDNINELYGQNYSLIIIDIKLSDVDSFKKIVQSLMNMQFNKRDVGYFLTIISMFDIVKSTKVDSLIPEIKENIKDISKTYEAFSDNIAKVFD